ncbi:MAG: molecular chaperone TorD family protein [Planctomycetes bacterium]|nr:molecular chaperone TorD family protein [Planctomycetota bacterium]
MNGLADLTAAARLFGRLLLRELDAETVRELQHPEVTAALRALGVEPPAEQDLPALAADYFACLLQPEGAPPPVHSLWRDGRYHGEPAIAVQRIARAGGLELSAIARNAAPDHLGCILLLWAELAESHAELARLLVEQHLAWAAPALAPAVRAGGFYGAVGGAALQLIDVLRGAE